MRESISRKACQIVVYIAKYHARYRGKTIFAQAEEPFGDRTRVARPGILLKVGFCPDGKW